MNARDRRFLKLCGIIEELVVPTWEHYQKDGTESRLLQSRIYFLKELGEEIDYNFKSGYRGPTSTSLCIEAVESIYVMENKILWDEPIKPSPSTMKKLADLESELVEGMSGIGDYRIQELSRLASFILFLDRWSRDCKINNPNTGMLKKYIDNNIKNEFGESIGEVHEVMARILVKYFEDG